ncbi:MAG TPA: hypothetical protein PLA85_13090 [Micropepsaceae bacterium]|nr:hypothetical protein [Micropepsaceae bacterium]
MLTAEPLHYGDGDGGKQDGPLEIWQEAFAAPGSMRRMETHFHLAPPTPPGVEDRTMLRGRQIATLRSLGFAGTRDGKLLLPLYMRDVTDPGVMEMLPWHGWTQRGVPGLMAYRLGLDDFVEYPCPPPIDALLAIEPSGAHHIIGQRTLMVHAYSREIIDVPTVDVRIDPRAWINDIEFDGTTRAGRLVAYPRSVLALPVMRSDIKKLAALIAWEPHLKFIRVLDSSPLAVRFAAHLQVAIDGLGMKRVDENGRRISPPEVLVAQQVGGGGA